ncbi:MAG: hypothetical protein GXP01_03065 [Alphaproteobacteria bacterium]|nr:hypothetical protein [Alphaproteobacteria bacterium]
MPRLQWRFAGTAATIEARDKKAQNCVPELANTASAAFVAKQVSGFKKIPNSVLPPTLEANIRGVQYQYRY